jgi:lipopolysaccharide/colanic/teichoic acid biosynthesis glycosyltransferase
MSTVRTGALGQLAAYGDVARHVGRGKLARLAANLVNRVLALLLLLLFSPLLVWVAVRIWQVDGAPILFAHYRVGRDGRLFGCLKFRTMVRDSRERLAQLLASDPKARADWERDQKLDHDPRITPIGHFLRRTSLDELPQLFNVLRGEMALVGPRPITVPELARYGVTRWHYLNATPGMTGLWQVSGRNDIGYAQRVQLDRRYVESRGLWLDLWILWRTASVVLRGAGAR